jgi:hypothetical protein
MSSDRLSCNALFSRLGGNRPQGGHFSNWRQHIINDLSLIDQSDFWIANKPIDRSRNE